MSKKTPVVEKLRRQIKKGKLAKNVALTYHLQGGVGENRVDETMEVVAPGKLHLRVQDELKRKACGETCADLKDSETLNLYQTLLSAVDRMVPIAEARFVPDTLVGCVSFIIGDEKQTFCFNADEEQCEHEGNPIPHEIKEVLERVHQVESSYLNVGIQGGKQ